MKRLGHIAPVMLAIASIPASSAFAKIDLAKDSGWNETFSTYELRRMANFSACVVRGHAGSAAYVLAVSTAAPDSDANLENFVRDMSHCAPDKGEFAFGNAVLVGDMAADLLKHRGKIAGLAEALAPRADGPRVFAHDEMEMTGICLAQKAPASVAALLSSDSESAADAALNDLTPLVAGCVPAGTKARLSRQGLRALVTIAAYRIVTPASEHGG